MLLGPGLAQVPMHACQKPHKFLPTRPISSPSDQTMCEAQGQFLQRSRLGACCLFDLARMGLLTRTEGGCGSWAASRLSAKPPA